MPPNPRLLAMGFHCRRSTSLAATRSLNSPPLWMRGINTNGIGTTSKDHVTKTKDKHNVYIDASKAGIAAKKSSDPDDATSGRDTQHNNEKAKVDYPEAPKPIVGMNDEKGHKK